MTDVKLLNERIEATGLKKGYIASVLGISLQSFSNKVNGKTEFKTVEIATLCELLGIKSLREKDKIFFAKLVEDIST